MQARVEDYRPLAPFDGVIIRAFASINDMLSWCHHLPASGEGRFYALKGTVPEEELAGLPAHYRVESVVALAVPQLQGERHLVVIRAG